jgi:hypothetical protein
MAKQLTITDSTSGVTYTLEYTRKTVEMMEKQGFIISDVLKKPMTLLPTLFAGAFLAHHRFVKPDVISNIYTRLTNKDELINRLVEMYNDPLVALLDEPEQGDSEGNLSWKAGW